VYCGGVHGVFDKTNQTRGAAASDQGAFHSRAPVKQPEGHDPCACENPKFADLIPVFLQNCRQNVIAMLDALDRGDFEIVEILGYGMRGAGGSYGFQAITDIGAALEQAAESADTDETRKWVGELSRYLDRVEIISD
jgi:hypothetical protein